MQSQDQIWDPEHDWILHFERILKPGGALASSALAKNDTAKFRHHHEGTVSCMGPFINYVVLFMWVVGGIPPKSI